MAGDTEAEMKTVVSHNLNIDNYRKLVQTYLNMHVYNAALFWADKVVALTSGSPRDVYWLAQCMFLLKQYHRAAHLLRSKNLDKTYILCNYLTVRCLLEANELTEALKVLNSMDMEVFLQSTSSATYNSAVEAGMFDDTPRHHVQSAVLLLKGKVLEAMDNRGLASDCYKQALQCDVYCFEAFDALIKHHMLSATEEHELLHLLPITQQCTVEEAEVLLTLYKSKLKKYHTITASVPSKSTQQTQQVINPNFSITPQHSSVTFHHNYVNETPNVIGTPVVITTGLESSEKSTVKQDPKKRAREGELEQMLVDMPENSVLVRLQDSLDLAVSRAEQLYYNCDYPQCSKLTDSILKQDPYHMSCLPIHISCQVELKQSNKLFALAHNLVDLYPNLAISWFAVGCYYYVIGKRDSARRYLAKATSLDRLFGPAWLAFGHSFAVENEHDQAMAAYFKASQLMRGCHLPLLYIGLECGLTNNVRLAEKFFQQAQAIAPDDPFVMHEMGVIAFQNFDYKSAEKHFKEALARVKPTKGSMVPERWEPLLNNLGHTYRKLKKYDEALEYHHQALVLIPQSANTYSAIGYVHALMNHTEEAVDWFHRALGLRRDDTFSTTMLNYVIEQLSVEQPPYPDAPDHIPDFQVASVVPEGCTVPDSEDNSSVRQNNTSNNISDMSIEIDMQDASGAIKE